MMLYICKECGAVFSEQYEYEEKHGFTDGPFEKWSACPYCGESGCEHAAICDNCSITVAESDISKIVVNGRTIEVCDKCYNKMEEED